VKFLFWALLAANVGIIAVLLSGRLAQAIGHPAADIIGGGLGLCAGIIAIVTLLPARTPVRAATAALDDAQ
jgi:hypothetical protein